MECIAALQNLIETDCADDTTSRYVRSSVTSPVSPVPSLRDLRYRDKLVQNRLLARDSTNAAVRLSRIIGHEQPSK